jgi:hypothetical protein
MKTLLSYLGAQVHTLTVYDFSGTDEQLETLTGVLQGYGVTVETAETGGEGPAGVAVLHRDGTVIGGIHVETLLEWMDIDRAFDGNAPEAPPLLSELSADVAVKPALTIQEMIRISREFERRALRAETGELHAGFQHLSQIKHSDRTVEMYTALAENGVDVYVYGVPDERFDDVPFTVVEDEHAELQRHWFLLYDGGDRRAALVSEECPTEDGRLVKSGAETTGQPDGTYESYCTTDPATVSELFQRAKREYEILRLSNS